MDPVSFVASLATLGALSVATSKKIHDFKRDFGTVPAQIEHLLAQCETFRNLTDELKARLQDSQGEATTLNSLEDARKRSVAQMERDLQGLQTVLDGITPILRKKSKGAKVFLLARHKINENRIEQYRNTLDTHCTTLSLIQSMLFG